jgi:phage antirepressor YoqD-like protein
MKDLLGEDLMTVKELAEILNVSTDLIKKRIRELFKNKMKPGQTTYLNEGEVTALKLRIQENSHIITTGDDRHQLPTTNLEKKLIIQQAMNFLTEEVESLKAINQQQGEQLTIQAPLVALAEDCIRDTTEHYSITNAGKLLGLSRSKIFSLLSEKRLLTSGKIPTQSAIDRKIISIRNNVVGEKNYPQAVMTMENIYNFKRVYEKDFK